MHPAAIAVSGTPMSFHPASCPDYLPREPMRGLQSLRLRQVVSQAYEHVPLYRQWMHKHGLTPNQIGSVDDLGKLPFSVPTDLSSERPLGTLTAGVGHIVRLHTARVAPGKPILVPYTRRDLEAWHEVILRSLACCGIMPGDIVLNASGHNLFAEGLGIQYGAEALGATVIPSATGDGDRQIEILKDFGVSAVCCTPSYFVYLVERAEKAGVNLHSLPLRTGIFLAEPWTEDMRRRVEETAGIKAYDLYGVPEILRAGVGAECCHENGLHIFEDHFFPEIVDPETGEPLPDGQEGELVLTALTMQAAPWIRYRTSDRTAILAEPCACGRTLRRIRRIERRGQEAFVLQGVQVFPAQIEAVLRAVGGTLPPYRIVPAQQLGPDHLEVEIEVTPQIFRDQAGAMENLQSRLTQEIERAAGIRVPVRFVEPHAIARYRHQTGSGTLP